MTKVGITSGLRGHYVVVYDSDTMEPIQTSPASHKTAISAEHEARELALDMGVPCDCNQPIETE
jgi:hypothetical protein